MGLASDVWQGFNDALGAVGIGLGALLGAVGASGSKLLEAVSFGHAKIFPGSWKHILLSSALGFGSLFAVGSNDSRTHFVGPTVNEAAGAIAGSAAWGDRIAADYVGPGPNGTTIVSVPASWGLKGKMVVHTFAGPIAEPYTEVSVPSSDYKSGVLTVGPGIAGALQHH